MSPSATTGEKESRAGGLEQPHPHLTHATAQTGERPHMSAECFQTPSLCTTDAENACIYVATGEAAAGSSAPKALNYPGQLL